jgi:integral membrane protein (TIGR01906 family)
VRPAWLVSIATALVLLGASILPFLTPAWVGFEQDRTQVTRLTGFNATDVRAVTGSILGDLVVGRGDFDAALAGTPVLDAPERQHLRDVRGVFQGVYLLVLAAAVALALTRRRARERDSRSTWWRAVRRGGAGLAVVVTILGAVSLVAFDAAFEVFHRLFFAPGTYLFDPATSHLVQLYPDQFWFETTVVLGVVLVLAAALTAWFAGRRADRAAAIPSTGAQPDRLAVGSVAR